MYVAKTHPFGTFDELEQFLREPLFAMNSKQSFPPYNVVVSKDGNVTKIEIAVAGFNRDDIDVGVTDGKLTVSGKMQDSSDDWTVFHKGIASRQFSLAFRIQNAFEAESAEMENGILTITLKRIAGFSKKLQISSKLNEVPTPQLLNEAA